MADAVAAFAPADRSRTGGDHSRGGIRDPGVRDQIESLLSSPTQPDAMIERVIVRRHESGMIEVTVRGRFAGVMPAAGWTERYGLIPRLVDQDPWAQLRRPMDMIRQG
jgi:hypothetical protein